jgi:hypothetical protein
MTGKLGHGKIVDGHADPRSLKGIERRRELMAEDAIEVKRIADHLIMTLGRPPRAELIGRTMCKIRRLDEVRRDNLAERQLLQGLLAVPFNVETNILGPRAPGKQFFVAERGDVVLAPDEATVADEVEK